jgi:hypothetical protein
MLLRANQGQAFLLALVLALALAHKKSNEGSQINDATANAVAVYVSIVMVGRHDDLRGDYTGRLQNSLVHYHLFVHVFFAYVTTGIECVLLSDASVSFA